MFQLQSSTRSVCLPIFIQHWSSRHFDNLAGKAAITAIPKFKGDYMFFARNPILNPYNLNLQA